MNTPVHVGCTLNTELEHITSKSDFHKYYERELERYSQQADLVSHRESHQLCLESATFEAVARRTYEDVYLQLPKLYANQEENENQIRALTQSCFVRAVEMTADVWYTIAVSANLRQANLQDTHLKGAKLDDETVMPEGWEDIVASRPEDQDARGPSSPPISTQRGVKWPEEENSKEGVTRGMKQSRTVTGKRFYYEGSISQGLVVYPTDEDGTRRSGGVVPIPAEGIDFIRGEIRRAGIIARGACRDNPASGSLGEKLRGQSRSPQWLSYVVPLLAEVGFCEFFKEGRRYMIRYTGV